MNTQIWAVAYEEADGGLHDAEWFATEQEAQSYADRCNWWCDNRVAVQVR